MEVEAEKSSLKHFQKDLQQNRSISFQYFQIFFVSHQTSHISSLSSFP
jgi:hypothetical protein